MSRSRRDDSGQVTVLILGFVGIIVMLIVVVTCASSVFLAKRSLAAAADGAALSAASALDEQALYSGASDLLPLDASRAADAVARYADDAELASRFSGFSIGSVTVTDNVVTVVLRSTVHLPFTHLGGRYASGVHLHATSSAQAPLR